ncbi:DRTGG domain-containing protein [Caloramator sp. mosi_1]|uniref:DRTGG domain-containing protein n=1 Tax=Caloramator sp. mosi_1 TaxID=3023090 RepID=UPI002361E9F3|nr:DRTGG domain-containing protein [Caloramator sp. mosi_1]WDC84844.1 DRTGG domain-containing protein [Caloramator sp. mosi_1]
MKVRDIVNSLKLKVLAGEEGLDKEVKGVYTCDLLSWVMSHGKQNNAWITVQIHPNIIAVATLLEFSCIIIPEDIEVEDVTINKANEENIPVLQSNLNAYELCVELNKLGA